MRIFHKLGAAMVVLTAALLLQTQSPANATHEEPPPEGPAPLPQDGGPWPGGFYYNVALLIGDAEDSPTDADFVVDSDWGAGIGFGIGYRLGPIRLEGELLSEFYRVSGLDLGPANPFPGSSYTGGMWTQGLMANLYFDLPVSGTMRPYLGAGYGVSRLSVEFSESVCIIFCFSTSNVVVDDWDRVTAWQGMLGVAFSSWPPSGEWYVGYRYFGTEDAELKTIGGLDFAMEGIDSHSFNMGFRMFF